MDLMSARKIIPCVLYVVVLTCLSLRLYVRPLYDIDMLGYIGNALLEEQTDPVRIHQRVYREVATQLPAIVQQHFTGQEAGAPESQNASRKDRASNAYHFAEFLPFFAIRPVYNQLLWLLSKSGMSLIRASVLVSVVSYFLLGLLVFAWAEAYVGDTKAAFWATLLMMSPSTTQIGRFTGTDCTSTLVALLALYLIWERRLQAPGITVLLFSIYLRTDNVALAVPVILVEVWQRRIPYGSAAVLLAVAIGSVWLINHFAGDYGLRMLYYRNFIGTPIAPAEVSESFSASDYVVAFRKGISDGLSGLLIPFLLLGAVGFLRVRHVRTLGLVALTYAVLHFVLLPNWQERWFAILYLVMGLMAVSAAGDCLPEVESLQR
jgi:hypothetical protein